MSGEGHSPPFDPAGVVWVNEQGRFRIPERFRSNATMHTTGRTVVRHAEATTTYETEHPGLATGGEGVFVAFQAHGDEAWTYFEVVPRGETPKVADPEEASA